MLITLLSLYGCVPILTRYSILYLYATGLFLFPVKIYSNSTAKSIEIRKLYQNGTDILHGLCIEKIWRNKIWKNPPA